MGTVFSLDVRGPAAGEARTGAALDAAGAWLEHVDETFSTYRPESQISRLAAGTLALSRCSPEVWEVMRLCEAAERRTRGYFSAHYAGGPDFDPTGLVKGWAVERAAAMLASSGAEAVCVNGGGDIQTHGGPWRIGVAHPLLRGALAAVVLAPPGASLAVATSGPAERGPHILDPHTGRPPADPLASLTVVAVSLTDADVHATAGYAMGGAAARAWLESLPATEAQAVTPSGEGWRTAGFGSGVRTAGSSSRW
ncbi:FAD:protein FMN transferase [Streptomyces sp. NRRL F-5123]|uniref:FAD:protein FMN transferase n=1 Tax=Streptomyces sp. NRRL F-5123 TaxID=1463856 RepID=UPI000694D7F3|nr:FAD:protein FMN transferase [Streptomyces sp. NRRL F-5123]